MQHFTLPFVKGGGSMKKIAILFLLAVSMNCISVCAKDNNVCVNGTLYDIPAVYLENERYMHSDSWYFPIREIFETLDCEVIWNVDDTVLGEYSGEQLFPQYAWRKSIVKDDITSQLYGATIKFNKNMPIIEVRGQNDISVYCQIGSESYFPFAGGTPPVLIDGKTYVSVCFIDYAVSELFENIKSSAYWDSTTKERKYDGAITFKSDYKSLSIDTDMTYPKSIYKDILDNMNINGNRIIQQKENEKYFFCLVEYANDDECQTFLSVNKSDGTIKELDRIDKNISRLMHIVLSDESFDCVSLYKDVSNEGDVVQLKEYKKYNI